MNEKLYQSSYAEVLPVELEAEDIDRSRQFLESLSITGLNSWIAERTVTNNFNGQPYRMVIDRPTDGNHDKALIVLSEYGTGILPRLVAKSRVMRDTLDPDATLIIQPSTTRTESNMNYSKSERSDIYKGDLRPVISRLAIVMESLGSPEDLTIFGPSQGAMIGMAYAGSDYSPSASVVAVEAPNIVDRSGLQLAIDLTLSGSDLSKVVSANFNDHSAPFAVLAEKDASSVKELSRFLYSSLHPDNLATMGAMRYSSLSADIDSVISKGGNIVHVWGDKDNVSPSRDNELIAQEFGIQLAYKGICLPGMTHSITDFYALDGALTRMAHNRKNLKLFRHFL